MKVFGKIYTAIIFILLYAPIFVLIALSFNASKSTVSFDGFTFQWYRELFTSSNLMGLLLNTLILAVTSSVAATVLGTTAAIGICKMKKRTRRLVMSVTNIPMSNPEIVTGVSLALLFVFVGTMLKIDDVLGFWTLFIAHVTFNLPYVILSVMPKLRGMDKTMIDAALDLGCTPSQAFRKITLPEILPGVISGFVMAFTLSLDDFVISYFVSGSTFTTLPVEIYNYTKKPISPTIYALFTLMFLIILILLIAMNVADIRRDKKKAALYGRV